MLVKIMGPETRNIILLYVQNGQTKNINPNSHLEVLP